MDSESHTTIIGKVVLKELADPCGFPRNIKNNHTFLRRKISCFKNPLKQNNSIAFSQLPLVEKSDNRKIKTFSLKEHYSILTNAKSRAIKHLPAQSSNSINIAGMSFKDYIKTINAEDKCQRYHVTSD